MSARCRGLRRIATQMALLGCALASPLAAHASDGTIYFRGMIVEPPYNIRVVPAASAGATIQSSLRDTADIRFDTDARERPNVRVMVNVLNQAAIDVKYAGKAIDPSRPLALIGRHTANDNATLSVAAIKGPVDAVVTVSYD